MKKFREEDDRDDGFYDSTPSFENEYSLAGACTSPHMSNSNVIVIVTCVSHIYTMYIFNCHSNYTVVDYFTVI